MNVPKPVYIILGIILIILLIIVLMAILFHIATINGDYFLIKNMGDL
jgi:hypothetical protein